MLEKLRKLALRYREIESLMARPEVASDPARMGLLSRELGRLRRPHELYSNLEETNRRIEEARRIAGSREDLELAELARQDLERLLPERERIITAIEDLLLDEETGTDRDVVLEIRPGTGGDEAALFAADLVRMYTRYAERRGWKLEVLDLNHTDLGGVRAATLLIQGDQAYKFLRYEGGTHRVQRVPKTESGGRIHTSAATVAVVPDMEDIELELKREDLEIKTARAGGPGGQHQNKTESAIQITHRPTGITVKCRSDRSQTRNRELAMRLLRVRLTEYYKGRQKAEIQALRRSQIGSGDRSEKIRTYNFPQNRVTDHRINYTSHDLQGILDGDLDEIVRNLVEAERQKRRSAMRVGSGDGA